MSLETTAADQKMVNHAFSYRPEIDGLRAVAVLSVLIFHAFPEWLPGGFVGVDVFFVISGYLITAILHRELASERYSTAEFYRRRIDRLFPALLVMLGAVYAFGWFTLFADEFMQLGKQMAGGAGFVANIVLFSETGYFNESSATKPLLHLWSLGIEEQFYLVFPIILYAAFKLRAKPILVVSVLLAASFLLNLHSIKTDVERTFYLPQYRHWELLAGSILALLLAHGNPLSRMPVASSALSVIGLALIGYSIWSFNEKMAFPGWYAAAPVIGTFLVIAAASGAWINRRILGSKPMVAVGLISFPLYLWHWPLLSIAQIINGGVPSVEVRWGLLIASFVLAILTYQVIEKPLKRVKSWPKKTLPMAGAMAVLCIAGVITLNLNGIQFRANIKVSQEVSNQLTGSLWAYSNNDYCKARFNLEESKDYKWWFCMLTRDEEPDVLLLGNSYANHLYPGIANSSKLKNLNVLSIGACDPTTGSIHSEIPGTGHPCSGNWPENQRAFIHGIIKNTPKLQHVIISGVSVEPKPWYTKLMKDRIATIEASGKSVIIFGPHVLLKNNIKGCFARPLKKPMEDCETDLAEVTKIRESFGAFSAEIKKTHPNVKFFDPNSLICDDRKCSSVRKGLPIYRDQFKHLSVFASMELGDIFAEWAEEHAPELLK